MKRNAFIILLLALAAATAVAQQPQTPARPTKMLSSSLGLYAFPAQNQNTETQQKDEAACYSWAQGNTGFDPLAASAAPPQEMQAPKGAAAKGAAGGAAAGAAIGAISGDAGQGAATGAVAGAVRGKLAQKKAERRARDAQSAAAEARSSGMQGFRKAFSACMEGKGYSVK